MSLVAASLLFVAAWTQFRAARFIAGPARVWAVRGLLALVGAALGWLFASSSALDGASPVAMFLIGFGGVHVPAALILFFKAWRGEGQS